MKMAKTIREGSVSRVLKCAESSVLKKVNKEDLGSYTIELANTPEKRKDAFKLAYGVYLEKGYIAENDEKILTNELDSLPDTTIIVVYDQFKEAVATATLNFEKYGPMPCREIFDRELLPLKTSGNQIAEVTRLAIKDASRDSAFLLMQILHALLIYTYKIKKNESIVVEVNPKHAAFYEKLLGFDKLSGEVACSRVNYAPAVLLHLKLSKLHQAIIDTYGLKNKDVRKRILAFSLNANEAEELEKKFRNSTKPTFNIKDLVSNLFLSKQKYSNFCLV